MKTEKAQRKGEAHARDAHQWLIRERATHELDLSGSPYETPLSLSFSLLLFSVRETASAPSGR